MSSVELTTIVDEVSKGAPGVKMMAKRAGDFASRFDMKLAGIAMVADYRTLLDEELQRVWDRNAKSSLGTETVGYDEVVIGSGIHCAAYVESRRARRFAQPLVLERSARPGGEFAVSQRPSFRVNSRNRPGPLGEPGTGMALNVIPNGVMQPSMLSSDEFQTNADLAFVTRLSLARGAIVKPGADVISVSLNLEDVSNRRYTLRLSSGQAVYADRVIDARGVGDPLVPDGVRPGRSVQTFRQFMASLDEPFPLRGLQRVAVVGDGDSGKCAVEALLGIGPSQLAVSALDYVGQIDWFAPNTQTNCASYSEASRSRYKSIGGYLPARNADNFNSEGDAVQRRVSRLQVVQDIGVVRDAGTTVFVRDQPYDRVILCVGYRDRSATDLLQFGASTVNFGDATLVTARRVDKEEVYQVGPRASIRYSSAESSKPYARIAQNVNAIFRTIGRTAALATSLGR